MDQAATMNWCFAGGQPRVGLRRRRQHAAGGTLRIEVFSAGRRVEDGLRRSVGQRLLYALSRYGAGIERVAVRLSDVANPLGGVDQRCRMRAWLTGKKNVRVETMDGPLAIDRAVGRLAERVGWALVDGRAEETTRLRPVVSAVERAGPAEARHPHASREAGRSGPANGGEKERPQR